MRKKRWVPWVLVGPALLIIVLTTIYPLLAALYFSFHKYKLRTPPQFAIQIRRRRPQHRLEFADAR